MGQKRAFSSGKWAPGLLSVFICLLAFGSVAQAGTAIVMESSKMRVYFDSDTGEPNKIVNLLTGNSINLVPESAFILDTNVGTINGASCTVDSVTQDGTELISLYTCADGNVTVTYSLEPEDHFMLKNIRFEPSPTFGSYMLQDVCVQKFQFGGSPGSWTRIQFRHGTCNTHFIRDPEGFFFGVAVPVYESLGSITGSIELGYTANYRYPAGSVYEAETSFWGVYELADTLAPSVPEWFKECQQSTTRPDYAESDAMVAMVHNVVDTRRYSVDSSFNGWDFDLLKNGLGKNSSPSEINAAKATLGQFKSQLGDVHFTVSLATTWGGMCYDMEDVDEIDTEPPTSAEMLDFTAWCRDNQIKLENWEPLKGIMPWFSLYRYCDDYVPWQGDNGGYMYNCPVNREFMAWLTNMVIKNCKHSRAYGFALDESGPAPRTGLPCIASGHDHDPGDASYGYFYARRKLFQDLRKEFGPKFLLWGGRPQQDCGMWDCLYLDGVMTLKETGDASADTIRYWSRIRYYYHFMPSYIDQATLKDRFLTSPDDYNHYQLLSALAVSNFYLFIDAPTESQAGRVRYWLEWADHHKELMRSQTYFLPDWPGFDASGNFVGNNKCDSYMRIKNGQGFIFIFNANSSAYDAVIPLDDGVGLHATKTYVLGEAFSTNSGATIPAQAKGSVTVTNVPARTALLLSVEPLLVADLDNDDDVDFDDLALLGQSWLESNLGPPSAGW